jgi:hypothetical protein
MALELSAEERCWIFFPREIRRWVGALLHQQCWCWGYDVRCPEGNLLVEYGFVRKRPPVDCKGSSAYLLQRNQQRSVALWGFGFFYGDATHGGLFLSRYNWTLRYAATAQPPVAWKIDQLHEFRPPRCGPECASALLLLEGALEWLAEYEGWVMQRRGPQYRERSLDQWPHSILEPQQVPGEWQRMAHLAPHRARWQQPTPGWGES